MAGGYTPTIIARNQFVPTTQSTQNGGARPVQDLSGNEQLFSASFDLRNLDDVKVDSTR